MKSGVDLIAEERARQRDVELWCDTHDDQHKFGEMALAAMSYARPEVFSGSKVPFSWPWDTNWWKPSDDKVRNLVKAGALIAAEIDRLQRLTRAGLRQIPGVERIAVDKPQVNK